MQRMLYVVHDPKQLSTPTSGNARDAIWLAHVRACLLLLVLMSVGLARLWPV